MGIENGMIVGAERHDKQLWEAPAQQCPICGKIIGGYDPVYVQAFNVVGCENCIEFVEIDETLRLHEEQAWRIL